MDVLASLERLLTHDQAPSGLRGCLVMLERQRPDRCLVARFGGGAPALQWAASLPTDASAVFVLGDAPFTAGDLPLIRAFARRYLGHTGATAVRCGGSLRDARTVP